MALGFWIPEDRDFPSLVLDGVALSDNKPVVQSGDSSGLMVPA